MSASETYAPAPIDDGAARSPAWMYLASFVVLGATVSLLGPALTGLRERTGAGVGAISILFVAVGLGTLIGSILAGIGYDRGLGHRLMGGALVALGLVSAAVAWAPTLLALTLVFPVLGIVGGSVDVGGNTLVVWAKARNAAPFLNALHLSFGIGALLAPLIVNRALAWGDGIGPAYAVMAGPTILVGALVLSRRSPTPVDAAAHDSGGHAPRRLLAALALFFFLYVGVELGFGGWVYTYAQEVDVGGDNGPALLTATFWGAFTLGRVVAVWIAHRLAPARVLAGSCALAVLAALLLVVADGAAAPVWIGTALFGLGVAPQFATMIAYAERHLPITGEATSWFLGASSLGGLALPWLIGQLLDSRGASAMPWTVVVASAATLAWYAVVHRLLGHRAAVVIGAGPPAGALE